MKATVSTGQAIGLAHGPLCERVAGTAPPNAFTLLFPAGSRPAPEDVARLLALPDAGISASEGHRSDPEHGWMEIVVNGLVFELRGLASAAPAGTGAASQGPGPGGTISLDGLEALELAASAHVAAGSRLLPVVREMFHLAANLALRLPTAAVIWKPTCTMLEPRHFARIVYDWLAGGTFPALGLSLLSTDGDGSVSSRGLAHFAGQEFRLEARPGEAPADSVRLAVQAADWLVRNGPLASQRVIAGGREALVAEPSSTGRHVWIWRDAD